MTIAESVREQAAKVCEEQKIPDHSSYSQDDHDYNLACDACATTIRAMPLPEPEITELERINAEPLAYGVVRGVEVGRNAADQARREGLHGLYPAACVVLSMKLARLSAGLSAREAPTTPEEEEQDDFCAVLEPYDMPARSASPKPQEPTEAMIEAICAAATGFDWPADFGEQAQDVYRRFARVSYAAVAAALGGGQELKTAQKPDEKDAVQPHKGK